MIPEEETKEILYDCNPDTSCYIGSSTSAIDQRLHTPTTEYRTSYRTTNDKNLGTFFEPLIRRLQRLHYKSQGPDFIVIEIEFCFKHVLNFLIKISCWSVVDVRQNSGVPPMYSKPNIKQPFVRLGKLAVDKNTLPFSNQNVITIHFKTLGACFLEPIPLPGPHKQKTIDCDLAMFGLAVHHKLKPPRRKEAQPQRGRGGGGGGKRSRQVTFKPA